MALSRKEINALNVLGVRKLDHIPDNFTKLSVNGVDLNALEQWVNFNLDSRYAIKKSLKLDANNKMVENQEIGLEDSKEITMLTLACPHLHSVIDVAAQRGAFRAAEMSAVGAVFNKLNTFLEAVYPQQLPPSEGVQDGVKQDEPAAAQ